MTAAPLELITLDLETTGLDPELDRIIEVGAVKLGADLTPHSTFTTLVNPKVPLPLAVTRVTGIREEELRESPPFEEAYTALATFVGSATLVAHNASFDRSFLAAAARRADLPPLRNPWFDSLEAALLLLPELDRHALPLLAEFLSVHNPPHRALSDALTTVHLVAKLRGRAAQLDEEGRRLLAAVAWRPLTTLDQLPPAPPEPPPPTPAVPSAEAQLAALPVSQEAWRSELSDENGEGAGMAKRLPGFRHRPGQEQLAGAVAEVFTHGGVGLLEAGTGMGKSLAYLLPTACFSAASGRRVVVSTKTKALQRQLAAHELPLVAQAMPSDWRWTLLMGRENYLCRRRLEEAVAATEEELPDRERALALAYLCGRARYGELDLSALPFRALRELPALRELARELRSSRSTCLGRHCPHRRACYWLLARKRAEAAHVVCVNHALLLTGRETLPPFEDVVIDEAHLLPQEATEALSECVEAAALELLVAELRGDRRRRGLSGRLHSAARKVLSEDAPALLTAAAASERAADELPDLLHSVEFSLHRLTLVHREDEDDAATPGASTAERGGYDLTFRLTPGLRERPEWDAFSTATSLLAEKLDALAAALRPAAEALPETHRERANLASLAEEAGSLAVLLSEFAEGESAPERVVWGRIAATHRGGSRWSLHRTPLTPAQLIRTALWERLHSAVLTSATITVADSFAYFRSMTGLSADLDVHEAVFPSPFDFRRQAVLVVHHDSSGGWRPGDLATTQRQRLVELAEATGGRTLALFTNKREMEAASGELDEHLAGEEVLVLTQGLHGTAAALAEEFKSHPKTILLGVDTLWTGQDFPGDSLTCLVIAKLPFPRQDPLFRARRQACVEAGVDWFRRFYLPEAILKFRQGFGRLIRTEADTGVVVVLDQRLTQKAYGREFLASLPELEVVRAAPQELAATVSAHLRRLTGER